MKKRRVRVIINWTMLISLIVVSVTGMLLKSMPSMWMGISHGVSGYVLMVSAIIHILQNGMFRRRKAKNLT